MEGLGDHREPADRQREPDEIAEPDAEREGHRAARPAPEHTGDDGDDARPRRSGGDEERRGEDEQAGGVHGVVSGVAGDGRKYPNHPSRRKKIAPGPGRAPAQPCCACRARGRSGWTGRASAIQARISSACMARARRLQTFDPAGAATASGRMSRRSAGSAE